MASLIFNWKRVEAESRILKQSSEHRERQFSEPLKCLNMWECLSEAKCSRMRVAKCLLVSPHFATRIREHLASDKHSHIFKHLRGSENCRSRCSEDCFKILDSASTRFQLKIKEAMHILWEQPSLNSQVKHLNLSLSY